MSELDHIQFSDDDVESVTAWEEYVLPFGKYKGTSLEKMIEKKETRNYLRYLQTAKYTQPDTLHWVAAAMDAYAELKSGREQQDKNTTKRRRKIE
jgi:hypothetical protein